LKKPTCSVRFRFYKPKTEKTEPNPNRKTNEPNREKTEPNRKNRVKPVWTGFCPKKPNQNRPVWTGFGFLYKKIRFGYFFFYKNRTEPKMITFIHNVLFQGKNYKAKLLTSSIWKKKKKNLNWQKQFWKKKQRKKNHMRKHCNNQQCFKEKTTKLNSQPAQY
jgi:hypothetical protein